MADGADQRHLSWFLGPKAENSVLLEQLLLTIVQDYVHWRRNYFPSDRLLPDSAMKDGEPLTRQFVQSVHEMMAHLRRNFPFYSPRYIAHQLSDPTLPAVVGYFAGLLYNANNVTPEAAPVTVDWEIEACNRLLVMLGFTPPPAPPHAGSATADYYRRLEQEYGWCHLTHGGTTANLEALWLARTVRYFPLAVRDVARQSGLSIKVRQPNGTSADIEDLEPREVLALKPNEAIYLLARFVTSVAQKYGLAPAEAGARAWKLLGSSRYSPGNSLGAAFVDYPPVILVSGAAHYSVRKAADVLGIGRENVRLVDMDQDYRLDPRDLERKIVSTYRGGEILVAVIAIAGTTEEGAVDPIHEVLNVRASLETTQNVSFWLHVDAAWAGYLRALFAFAPTDHFDAVAQKLGSLLGFPYSGDPSVWQRDVLDSILQRLRHPHDSSEASDSREGATPLGEEGDVAQKRHQRRNAQQELAISSFERTSRVAIERSDGETFITQLQRCLLQFGQRLGLNALKPSDIRLSLQDRIDVVANYVSAQITLDWGKTPSSPLKITWGDKSVCSAFVAMESADSITIDPHKMGYVPYPCGAVAFRNDRIRHFILQRAPYITSVKQNVLVHMPPKRTEAAPKDEIDGKVIIEAFAPFIVEGSRPGAAACALWLATNLIPLTMRQHGAIIRASLLAARELFEWLSHWGTIMKRNGVDTEYEFVPLTRRTPGTNIVIFAVKRKTSSQLESMNELTRRVYQAFSIDVELGARDYSYSQPFFLSKTTCSSPEYGYETLRPIFDKWAIRNSRASYAQHGLTVLRATVMNPYIHPIRQAGNQNFIKEFMKELAAASKGASRALAVEEQ